MSLLACSIDGVAGFIRHLLFGREILIRLGLQAFWSLVVVLTVMAMFNYKGQWFVYLLFSIVANLLLYFGFRKHAIFFDAFIGVLLWLGFWMKSSVRIAFLDSHFAQPTGGFDGSAAAFDQVLLISSCGLLAFVVASLVRQKFFFNYPEKVSSIPMHGLFNLYRLYRKAILTTFFILVVAVAMSNAWFGIYQRGEVPQTILPYGLNGICSWLLLFGLCSFAAVIMHFEFILKNRMSFLVAVLAMMETFMSSVSMLSRGMILNGGALFYGAFKSEKARSTRTGVKLLLASMAMFALLFVLSVLVVNHLRASDKLMPAVSVNQVIENNGVNKLVDLVLDRWVGIEGVMAVASYSDRGWALWETAWGEKFDVHKTSFYDHNLIVSPYHNLDTSTHHYVSLPGIVAFFFYPGSYLFLFGALFAAGLLGAFIEYSAYALGGRNLILCALIAQVVAYRYMSFGYVPARSYMLFGSIYLNLILIFAAGWFFNRHGLFANRAIDSKQ